MPPIESLPGLPEDYTPKFFIQDVVAKIMDPAYRGTVVRCWSTDEHMPPPTYLEDSLDRPLKRGEVGIMENAYTHSPKRELISEANLVLVHRDFFPGDVVKRSLTNSSSAVVLGIESEVQLYSAYDKTKKIKGWVPYDKLKCTSLEPGDKVVYDQWIGTIQDIFEAGHFAGAGKESYFVTAPSGFFGIGATIEQLIDRHHAHIPPLPPVAAMSDVCLNYHALVLAISWNAINQQLPVAEQEKHPEPPALWLGDDMAKLTWWPAVHRQSPMLRQPVRFKNQAEGPVEDTPADPTAKFPSETPIYKVDAIRNKIKVRWQDGSETTDFNSAFVPYPNIDDYETWPGDHLIWHGDEGERKAVVVQSFDARQRVANLLFSESGEKSTVSVLELETAGPEHLEYGVRIGEIVLLTPDNGEAPPSIPPLGRFEVDRAMLEELDKKARDFMGPGGVARIILPPYPAGDRSAADWWGEVCALDLDGSIKVRLANGTTTSVGLKQLVRLRDGEQGMDDQMDEMMEAEDEFDEMLEAKGIAPGEEIPEEMRERVMEQMMLRMMGEEFTNRGFGAQFEMWKSQKPELNDPAAARIAAGPFERRRKRDEEDDGESEWETMDGSNDGMDEDEPEGPEDASMKDMDEVDQKMDDDKTVPAEEAPPVASSSAGPSGEATAHKGAFDDLEDDEAWQRFTILESAPANHHFITEKTGGANKAYQNRLQKERKTLMNALPENIFVRTYEDRTDLMRVLVIGPESTPYANAPFIFDVYLKPTAFPQEPPLVHFHSHTNGLGRCNPNLYEEGKVCLSVLGTWGGEQSETWNPAKSSLLQVFVSISGLVLVRSPYFCEPGVAKLEGTREGRLNSRLYSEKAYILSRNFVRQALTYPPEGFEEEIKHFYLARGRLRQVLDHAKNLITSSEAAAAKEENEEVERSWNEDAVGDLTMGAVITLKKTVAALEKIAEKEGVA